MHVLNAAVRTIYLSQSNIIIKETYTRTRTDRNCGTMGTIAVICSLCVIYNSALYYSHKYIVQHICACMRICIYICVLYTYIRVGRLYNVMFNTIFAPSVIDMYIIVVCVSFLIEYIYVIYDVLCGACCAGCYCSQLFRDIIFLFRN